MTLDLTSVDYDSPIGPRVTTVDLERFVIADGEDRYVVFATSNEAAIAGLERAARDAFRERERMLNAEDLEAAIVLVRDAGRILPAVEAAASPEHLSRRPF